MGSLLPLAAFANLVIYSTVNVWFSLWHGMVDRGIYHGDTRFTGHLRSSSRLEQQLSHCCHSRTALNFLQPTYRGEIS